MSGLLWRPPDMARLRWRASVAAFEVLIAARRLKRLIEKANFNPQQPRLPRGHPDGGQWTRVGAAEGGEPALPAMARNPFRLREPGTAAPRIVIAQDLPDLPPKPGEPGGPAELPEIDGLPPRPDIPERRPATTRRQNIIAREAGRWLARVALQLSPIGRVLNLISAGHWLEDFLPQLRSYLDEPRTLEDLQARAQRPREAGYDDHHIIEQAAGRREKFEYNVTYGPQNVVRIPRWRHWMLNSWYETENEDYGGMAPREFLEGNGVPRDHIDVGLDGLRYVGVLR